MSVKGSRILLSQADTVKMSYARRQGKDLGQEGQRFDVVQPQHGHRLGAFET